MHDTIWESYWKDNNLYRTFSVNERTMQKIIENQDVGFPSVNFSKVVVGIDTTYHGDDAIMLFRALNEQQNIYWRHCEKETVTGYEIGLEMLKIKGYDVQAVVCDDLTGLVRMLGKRNIPVQLCQFHVMKNVIKKITRNPKLEAGKELKEIVMKLPKLNRDTFEGELGCWYLKNRVFLQEKSIDERTGKKVFTHRKLRSAYFGLKRRMDYIFTYERYPDLNIPKTNNGCESTFGYLKTKLNVHRGLKGTRKQKLIDQILFGSPTQKYN